MHFNCLDKMTSYMVFIPYMQCSVQKISDTVHSFTAISCWKLDWVVGFNESHRTVFLFYLIWNLYTKYTHMTKKNEMKSKNEMTLQKVTCTNSCQHAINLRSSPFAIRSIQYSYFQQNQYESKSNTTAVDRRQLHWNVVTTARRFDTRRKFVLPWNHISRNTARNYDRQVTVLAHNKLRAK